jgi:hypothetical protein
MWVRHIEPNAHCECHHNRSGEPKRHNLTLANITDPHFNHTTLSLLHLGSGETNVNEFAAEIGVLVHSDVDRSERGHPGGGLS